MHATHVHSFQIINAISATITSAEAKHLQANPSVRAVVPDVFRHFASLGSGPGPALPALAGEQGPARREPVRQQICPTNPAQPIIEPEAETVMNVDAAEQIADGTGVKVGIIADGIDPNNPDLIRANGQHVIFDYQDFSGFGTTRRPTAVRRSSTRARSPRRATRPTTCRGSSTPRIRCRRAATSRSRASRRARASRS